jgi:hypothetical protein
MLKRVTITRIHVMRGSIWPRRERPWPGEAGRTKRPCLDTSAWLLTMLQRCLLVRQVAVFRCKAPAGLAVGRVHVRTRTSRTRTRQVTFRVLSRDEGNIHHAFLNIYARCQLERSIVTGSNPLSRNVLRRPRVDPPSRRIWGLTFPSWNFYTPWFWINDH